jgi:hypothetical protein
MINMASILLLASPIGGGDQALAPPDPEIVVTGQRFATWRGKARQGKQGWTCKTTRKSGSKVVDTQSCAILVACIGEEQARADPATPFAQSRQKPTPAQLDSLGRCLKERRDAAIAALAANPRR